MSVGSVLEDVARDAPLRLSIAAKLAFPDGSMTVSDLRGEAERGRLAIEHIDGVEFTTLRDIDAMRELCRCQPTPVDLPNDERKANRGSTLSRPLVAFRLLSREDAASYCSLSPAGFSNWVRSGRLPPAIPGTNRWDIKSIDRALDKLSNLEPQTEASPLDDWRAKRARRSEGNS